MPTKRTTQKRTPTKRAPAKASSLTAPLFSQEGKKVGDIKLDPKVFGVHVASKLLTKAVLVQRANSRAVLAHTKNRGERRGGGKKPWKQKGTGRARQGSTRSPQWRKGGVVFGPRSNRNFTSKLNRKERQLAILGALSLLAQREAGVLVLEELKLATIKTSTVAKLLKALPVTRKALLVLPERDATIELSARNLPHLKTQLANNLNVEDLMGYRHLVLPRAALERVTVTYTKES